MDIVTLATVGERLLVSEFSINKPQRYAPRLVWESSARCITPLHWLLWAYTGKARLDKQPVECRELGVNQTGNLAV